jgi:hypothetical protein
VWKVCTPLVKLCARNAALALVIAAMASPLRADAVIEALVGPGSGITGYPTNRYPAIDANGYVTFLANNASGECLYGWQDGVLSMLAAPGQVAPGTGGQTFGNIDYLDVEQQGPAAYHARLSGGGFGYFLHSPGGDALIGGAAIPVPGFPTSTFRAPPVVAANQAGQYVYWNQLTTDSGITGGIWANPGGTLQLVARDGTQVPGMTAGVTWTQTFSRPAVLPDGQALFFGVLSSGQMGLFESNGAATTAMALQNQAVPGHPGQTFGAISTGQVHPNHTGDFAFWDGSVWMYNSAGYHQVAKVGAPIIGGGNLTSIFSDPHISDTDHVIFGGLQTGNKYGLYYSDDAGIHVIANANMRPPEAAPTITFKTIYPAETNKLGQAAFVADLYDSSTGATLYNYLYATQPDGTLEYVTHGVSTIDDLLYSRDFTDIELTEFSDNGYLVFSSQGAPYITQVPEPASAACMLAGAAGLLLTRRRHISRR